MVCGHKDGSRARVRFSEKNVFRNSDDHVWGCAMKLPIDKQIMGGFVVALVLLGLSSVLFVSRVNTAAFLSLAAVGAMLIWTSLLARRAFQERACQ